MNQRLMNRWAALKEQHGANLLIERQMSLVNLHFSGGNLEARDCAALLAKIGWHWRAPSA